MSNDYRINFVGSPDKIDRVKEFSPGLEKDVKIKHLVQHSFSNYDGEKPKESLKMAIIVKNSFTGFITDFLIKKATGIALKKLFFDPVFKWLESIEMFDDPIIPDEMEFKYNDVTVIVAYTKRNQRNVVSQVTLKLNQLISNFYAMERGILNKVVTPLINNEEKWSLSAPPMNFPFEEYLKFWGLEFNDSNRCIYSIESRKIIDKYWWP